MNRVIIAGIRTFRDYPKLLECVDEFISTIDRPIVIISGGANGADKLGERYANHHAFPIKKFLPDWSTYGKSAGVRRNKQMAEYATHCICFWDGRSKGTASMIRFAEQHKLVLKIIYL